MDMTRFIQDLRQPLTQWWGQTPTQPQRQGQNSSQRWGRGSKSGSLYNKSTQRKPGHWRGNQTYRQVPTQNLGPSPVSQDSQTYSQVLTEDLGQSPLSQDSQEDTPGQTEQTEAPQTQIRHVVTQIPDQTATRQDQGTQTEILVQLQSPEIQQGPRQGQSPQTQQQPRRMLGQSSQTQQQPRQMLGQSSQTQQQPRQMQGQSSQTQQQPRQMQRQSSQIQQPRNSIFGQLFRTQQQPRQMQGQSSQIQQPGQMLGQSSQTQQQPRQMSGQSSQTQQPRQQRSGQDSRGQAQRRQPRMNDVNMPSGTKVSIVIPSRSTCSCAVVGENLKLITLKPDGKMSGREYKIVADEMHKTLQAQNYKSYTIKQIQKVQNCCLWSKFRAKEKQIAQDAKYVNERMLFHGSATADAIVKTGFDLNMARGGLFGHGVYFAKNSSKSNQYSPGYLGHRRMLLCRVALGRMHKTTTTGVTAPLGHHSVEGNLAVPEYVVYNADQAYPEYLVYYDISN